MNKYDPDISSKAGKAAVLRAVVAGYIGYLGYKIFCAQDTTMSAALSHTLGILFMLIAAAFGVDIFLRWRSDMKAAANTAEAAETDTETDDSQ